MAEVLGGVASGIAVGTLAAQIISSSLKLKSYWDQVRDAPDDIKDLIEALQIYSDILARMEDDQRQNPMTSTVLGSNSSCLKLCKQGVDGLSALTDNIQADLDASSRWRRKRGSMKVLLQKDQIDNYRIKLERAIRLLSLAYQEYTRALLQIQPDIIAATLSRTAILSINATSKPVSSDSTSSDADLIRPQPLWQLSTLLGTVRYSKRRYFTTKYPRNGTVSEREVIEETIAQYRSPAWLVNRAWQLQATKALSGWTFRPKMFNIIPSDSFVFELAENDDTEGLKVLFSEGKASPFDSDEYGQTALHIAARHRVLSVCELLLEQGADVDRKDEWPGLERTPVELLGRRINDSPSLSHHLLRLLLQKSDVDYHLSNFNGSKQFSYLAQPIIDPNYYEKPLSERVEIAFEMSGHILSDAWRAAISRGPFPDQVVSMANDRGVTLLHLVADDIDWIIDQYDIGDYSALMPDLRLILRELVEKGADLHHVSSSSSQTPLLALLYNTVRMRNRPLDADFDTVIGMSNLTPFILDEWIQGLYDCGINLVDYGRTETQLHMCDCVSWIFSWNNEWDDGSKGEAVWILKELYYGKTPKDLGFYVQSFYHTEAEVSEQRAPRAWLDDDPGSAEEKAVDGDLDGTVIHEDEVVSSDDELDASRLANILTIYHKLGFDTGESREINWVPLAKRLLFERIREEGCRMKVTIVTEGSPAPSPDDIGKRIFVVPFDSSDVRRRVKLVFSRGV